MMPPERLAEIARLLAEIGALVLRAQEKVAKAQADLQQHPDVAAHEEAMRSGVLPSTDPQKS